MTDIITKFQQGRESFFIKHGRYPSDLENQLIEQSIRAASKQKTADKEKLLNLSAERYRKAKGV